MPKVEQYGDRKVGISPFKAPDMNLGTGQYRALSNLGDQASAVGQKLFQANEHYQDTKAKNTMREKANEFEKYSQELFLEYKALESKGAVDALEDYKKKLTVMRNDYMSQMNGRERKFFGVQSEAFAHKLSLQMDAHSFGQNQAWQDESHNARILRFYESAQLNPTVANVNENAMLMTEEMVSHAQRKGTKLDALLINVDKNVSKMYADAIIQAYKDGDITKANDLKDAVAEHNERVKLNRADSKDADVKEMFSDPKYTKNFSILNAEDQARIDQVGERVERNAIVTDSVVQVMEMTDLNEIEQDKKLDELLKNEDPETKRQARAELAYRQKREIVQEQVENQELYDEIQRRLGVADDAITLDQMFVEYPEAMEKLTPGQKASLAKYYQDIRLFPSQLPKTDPRYVDAITVIMTDAKRMSEIKDPYYYAMILDDKDFKEFYYQWKVANKHPLTEPKEEVFKVNSQLVNHYVSMLGYDQPLGMFEGKEIEADPEEASFTVMSEKDHRGISLLHTFINEKARQFKAQFKTDPTAEDMYPILNEYAKTIILQEGEQRDTNWWDSGANRLPVAMSAMEIMARGELPLSDPNYSEMMKDFMNAFPDHVSEDGKSIKQDSLDDFLRYYIDKKAGIKFGNVGARRYVE